MPTDQHTPLAKLAAKRLKLPPQAVLEVVVVRKALDARRKPRLEFVYSLDVRVDAAESKVLSRLRGDQHVVKAAPYQEQPVCPGSVVLEHRPVVVGLGPAGLFAALTLARHGYRPLVLERGRDVDQRTADIEKFWTTGQLDLHSNVQFGEGGAGTFSDGKLTTRVNHPGMRQILELMVAAGAPPEIMYWHKPHIGTNKLRQVVKRIRQQIIDLGGQVRFQAQVTNIEVQAGQLKALVVNESERIACSAALFGIGHSARDTYHMLHNCGVAMEAKPFAIGVRIEHPQQLIDAAQYGSAADGGLPAADYALVYHTRDKSRTAYSFCMCPGGMVVASSSEQNGVVTNGMSHYERNSGIANSALVVNVGPADFGSGVLAGIKFQRQYEQLAFQLAGGSYHAPVQTVGDFLAAKHGSDDFLTMPSYQPGVVCRDLRNCLPAFVTATLAEALPAFGRKIKGFDDNGAVMTGVETRTSAPVRIVRTEDFMSLNTRGLYPIGEGAGYAGGIMSAALDGQSAACAVITHYRPITR